MSVYGAAISASAKCPTPQVAMQLLPDGQHRRQGWHSPEGGRPRPREKMEPGTAGARAGWPGCRGRVDCGGGGAGARQGWPGRWHRGHVGAHAAGWHTVVCHSEARVSGIRHRGSPRGLARGPGPRGLRGWRCGSPTGLARPLALRAPWFHASNRVISNKRQRCCCQKGNTEGIHPCVADSRTGAATSASQGHQC